MTSLLTPRFHFPEGGAKAARMIEADANELYAKLCATTPYGEMPAEIRQTFQNAIVPAIATSMYCDGMGHFTFSDALEFLCEWLVKFAQSTELDWRCPDCDAPIDKPITCTHDKARRSEPVP